jgi:hypothetical protein
VQLVADTADDLQNVVGSLSLVGQQNSDGELFQRSLSKVSSNFPPTSVNIQSSGSDGDSESETCNSQSSSYQVDEPSQIDTGNRKFYND